VPAQGLEARTAGPEARRSAAASHFNDKARERERFPIIRSHNIHSRVGGKLRGRLARSGTARWVEGACDAMRSDGGANDARRRNAPQRAASNGQWAKTLGWVAVGSR